MITISLQWHLKRSCHFNMQTGFWSQYMLMLCELWAVAKSFDSITDKLYLEAPQVLWLWPSCYQQLIKEYFFEVRVMVSPAGVTFSTIRSSRRLGILWTGIVEQGPAALKNIGFRAHAVQAQAPSLPEGWPPHITLFTKPIRSLLQVMGPWEVKPM